jgi:hypothetical protein
MRLRWEQVEPVLAARAVTRADAQAASAAVPGPRWPWLLAWLAIAAALWALERSPRGRRLRA